MLAVGTVFAADVAAVRCHEKGVEVLDRAALANRTCGAVDDEASDLGIDERRRKDCCILLVLLIDGGT